MHNGTEGWNGDRETYSFGSSRLFRNQQYLQTKIPPTDVAKLLPYSGSRVEHGDGFSS